MYTGLNRSGLSHIFFIAHANRSSFALYYSVSSLRDHCLMMQFLFDTTNTCRHGRRVHISRLWLHVPSTYRMSQQQWTSVYDPAKTVEYKLLEVFYALTQSSILLADDLIPILAVKTLLNYGCLIALACIQLVSLNGISSVKVCEF